ncbi:MAG: hypothetical protein JWR15_1009 [Prosthecobacter sp.]|nr:hypothetical protein [Prosthecobacter sp.]
MGKQIKAAAFGQDKLEVPSDELPLAFRRKKTHGKTTPPADPKAHPCFTSLKITKKE